MQIPRAAWNNYIKRLSLVSTTASALMAAYINKNGLPETSSQRKAFLDYANALTVKYGEGAAELACEMYDALAALEGVLIPAAEPAEIVGYGDVAKAINGTLKTSQNTEIISSIVGRMVKQASADTMLQNAKRDKAEWAWIPSGDTCAFCIALASRGWQPAPKSTHAEHIHSNCDCNYAIRHNPQTTVEGYKPDEYLEMYQDADGSSPKAKINALRREFYAENREKINAQKRDAYEKCKERESDKAEETNVD